MPDEMRVYSIKNDSWTTRWFKEFYSSEQARKAGFYKRSGVYMLSLLRLLVVLPVASHREVSSRGLAAAGYSLRVFPTTTLGRNSVPQTMH